MPRLSIATFYRGLSQSFRHVALHNAALQTFGGGYGFVLASNELDFDAAVTDAIVGFDRRPPRPYPASVPRMFRGA